MSLSLSVKKIKRALITVSDKEDLIEMAEFLISKGVEIISTGGTFQIIRAAGLPCTPVESVTHNKEAFNGRMKTLSFELFSSLLYRRDSLDDCERVRELEIEPIDLLICSFYPFQSCFDKFKKEECSYSELIENIDIGGPSLVRAAAKNYQSVTVLTDKKQYREFFDQMENHEGTTLAFRHRACKEAFLLTAQYEAFIALALNQDENLIDTSLLFSSPLFSKKLRYGENPHQDAKVLAFKKDSLASTVPLQGKELSYNNLLDSDAALKIVLELKKLKMELLNKKFQSGVVIVKHNMPCGLALSQGPVEALILAYQCDEVSAFGGIIAFTDEVPKACAQWLEDKFVEVIIAPSFSPEARDIFSKKKNLRLLALGSSYNLSHEFIEVDVKSIQGGILCQSTDSFSLEDWSSPTKMAFPMELNTHLQLGVIAAKFQKSNAIAVVSENSHGLYLSGSGGGQCNRSSSLDLALKKTQSRSCDLMKTVLVSDAFFPFKDNIELLNLYNIKYAAAPSGSIRDQEVIDSCNKHHISLAFLTHRHFRH